MTPIQLERIQKTVSDEQFHLFFHLSKMRHWFGELYLEFILSQEQIEYIYHSETNICHLKKQELDKRPHYFMR